MLPVTDDFAKFIYETIMFFISLAKFVMHRRLVTFHEFFKHLKETEKNTSCDATKTKCIITVSEVALSINIINQNSYVNMKLISEQPV